MNENTLCAIPLYKPQRPLLLSMGWNIHPEVFTEAERNAAPVLRLSNGTLREWREVMTACDIPPIVRTVDGVEQLWLALGSWGRVP